MNHSSDNKIFRIITSLVAAVTAVSITIVFSLLLLQNVPVVETQFKRTITSPSMDNIEVDFVIIGGGSAGCVLAARLAEYGFETLLLSSGSNDTSNPIMRQQSEYRKMFQIPHLKHNLPTNPSPSLNNRTLNVIVWNTLGGNSINAGGMERLMAHDWDYFLKATDDRSFDHQQMSKYYQMVETFSSNLPHSDSTNHGHHGPIKISQIYNPQFIDVWKDVAKELNETYTNDLSSTIDYGFSFEPTSFTNGSRSWSADAYLTPAMNQYPNLKVMTGATAIKFDVDEETKQVRKVLFVSKDGLARAIARKEYILSAGTFHSPHLLMLSGIGDPVVLREHGIPIKHELKQVGKNLMDNGAISMTFKALNLTLHQSIPVALINTQTSTDHTNPNTFIVLKMNNATETLTVMISNASPTSTIGSISLYNSNPLIPPKMNLDYLSDQRDLDTFIHAVRYVRTIMSTNAMKRYVKVTEILPGMNELDLRTYVKNTLDTAKHFTGTCSVGRNAEDSVVNNQFKVHGITNLRIVDASIFPANFTVKTGPLLTVYALAEKAAVILRQAYS